MRPPSSPAQLSRLPRISAARLVTSLVLVVLLFAATLYNEELYIVFGGWWYQLGRALGLAPPPPGQLSSAGSVSVLLHRARSIPAVVLYGVLYLGLCLGVLFLLVPVGSRRLVLFFYGGAGLATGLLLLGSRVGGGPALAVLASQLLHFIVSPLPVIVLVPVLRWAAVQPAAT
ncbi:MAG: hypothetical protein EOO59_04730 [Hymenobacter sp.]|nr:MAG: hypothetical protein EOO59_04730 [Hymenobacter sp.]